MKRITLEELNTAITNSTAVIKEMPSEVRERLNIMREGVFYVQGALHDMQFQPLTEEEIEKDRQSIAEMRDADEKEIATIEAEYTTPGLDILGFGCPVTVVRTKTFPNGEVEVSTLTDDPIKGVTKFCSCDQHGIICSYASFRMDEDRADMLTWLSESN